MARLHFYLKDSRQKTTSVQAHITGGNKKRKIGVGFSVETANWNHKTERLNKLKILSPSEQKDNIKLDEIEELFVQNRGDNIIEIAEKLKKFISTGSLGEVKTLVEGFQLKIDSIGDDKMGTKLSYATSKGVIENFRDVALNQVDLFYADAFVAYLKQKGYAKNTISKEVKNVKAVMNECFKRGLHTNTQFKDFKVETEATESIALTLEDIEKLKAVEVTGFEEIVRDIFLLGCYTGLRYSDYHQIKMEAIQGGNKLVIPQTIKTKKKVVVHLGADALRLIKKYGEIPITSANHLFNVTIKSVCKKAKIKGKVVITKTIGGKPITKTYNRYEVVTAHTSRRTFATIAYRSKMPTVSIMAITGHKTQSSFLKYIKVSEDEHADIMETYQIFD